MSRSYATDEQPDGHVCRGCADRALRTRGACPGCGEERALPGRRPGDGAATCTSCAGFSQSFACARCGLEGKLHGDRLCTRCTFADRLAGLLDDGTGRVRPGLVPLADALLAMDNPLSGLTWLCPRSGRAGSADDLLRRLARGEVELTHEAFNGLQPWRAASHLRDLLMSCGVLPAVDKQVCAFERWLGVHLATVADDGHAQVLRRFAAWEVLPGLRARAEKKPLNSNARGYAAAQILRASDFLRWLSGRGLALAGCRQADIDAWHAESSEKDRSTIRPFLRWCDQRIALRYHIPAPALSLEEASGYIRRHLQHAGRSDTLLSDDAVHAIHGHARGLPRAINRLAIGALRAAYTTGKTIVDESSARTAISEEATATD
jgi:hypothetical protein